MLLAAMEAQAIRVRGECIPPGRCEACLAGMAKGDAHAFEEFYRGTDKTIFAYALSLTRNREDAQDVMMESYLRLRMAADSYVPMGKPMAWVFTVVRNIAMTHYRKQGGETSWEELPEEGVPGHEESLLQGVALRAALEILDETERQVVLLHAVSGLRHREIAAGLGLPLGTVLSKYTRALGKLQRAVNQQEGGIR